MRLTASYLIATAFLACGIGPSLAQDDSQELAKKLSNPIASLISVPLQFNYNGNIGPVEDGSQYYVNVQPVIPITLNEDWNMISRTICRSSIKKIFSPVLVRRLDWVM